jgi:hypothetical protein
MNILQDVPISSPMIIILSSILFLSESITTFDMRVTQAKHRGEYPETDPSLPRWVSGFFVLNLIIKGALLILNWRFGLGAIVVIFILQVLPILETVGNILMAPFKPKR